MVKYLGKSLREAIYCCVKMGKGKKPAVKTPELGRGNGSGRGKKAQDQPPAKRQKPSQQQADA